MVKLSAVLLSLCVLGAAAAARAAPLQVPVTPIVSPLAPGAESRTVSLTRIVARIEGDEPWAVAQTGALCIGDGRLTWRQNGAAIASDELAEVFRERMQAAGFRTDGDTDNLFEETASFSEYAVAGLIKGAEGRLCFPDRAPALKLGGRGKVKGAAVLDVEWQIYSRVQRQVIARIETRAGIEARQTLDGGPDVLIVDAFGESVKALIAAPAFRKTFIGAPGTLAEPVEPVQQTRIALAAAPKDESVAIADAVGAVVLVLAGDGHGSGVLVSRDGYVMTDQHVVGAAKVVKVRWADGIEGVGQVVRVDRLRDVALIKTDPRGREPLPLRADPLRPGDTVYAIGAPLEERFQNTVTRGVVSAYRTIEGLRYIQSDVAISPGNSGGPLLDEHGAVVGLTKSTYRVENAPTGINFFTPTRDALDFLGAAAN